MTTELPETLSEVLNLLIKNVLPVYRCRCPIGTILDNKSFLIGL